MTQHRCMEFIHVTIMECPKHSLDSIVDVLASIITKGMELASPEARHVSIATSKTSLVGYSVQL